MKMAILIILLLVQILIRTYTNNKARYQELHQYFASTYIYASVSFIVRVYSLILIIEAYFASNYIAMIEIGAVYALAVSMGGMFIMWLQKREQKRYELSEEMARKADKIIRMKQNKHAPKNFGGKRGKK